MQERIKAFRDIAALVRTRTESEGGVTAAVLTTLATDINEHADEMAAAVAAERPSGDAREARARELYERVDKKLGQTIMPWERLDARSLAWWMAVADVIGEIERERHPLHVLTVAPDGSQTVRVVPEGWQPLTKDEARTWAAMIEKAYLLAKGWRKADRPDHWLDADGCTWPTTSAIDIQRRKEASPVLPPLGVVEDRTPEQQAADGDWRPKLGDRVRTVETLTGDFGTWDQQRRPNASGTVTHPFDSDRWIVRHDDGTRAPYEYDELLPEPAERLCVACLVTDSAARVLLVFNSKRAWELPGGGVHQGEAPIAAARREVVEETGIDIVAPTFIDNIHGTPKPGATYASRIFVYRATGEGKPVAGDDAAEAAWFSRADVERLGYYIALSDLASRDVLLAWARGAQ